MLALLLILSAHSAEPMEAVVPTEAASLIQLSKQLDTHQLALERVTRWRLREDLEPTQALCLYGRHEEARQLVAAARAVEVRLEFSTDAERVAQDLRALTAAETRVAAAVGKARSCLTCSAGDPQAAQCDSAAMLSMAANDLQGHRWREVCSLQQDYVCREVRDGCVCTEATLQDWIAL